MKDARRCLIAALLAAGPLAASTGELERRAAAGDEPARIVGRDDSVARRVHGTPAVVQLEALDPDSLADVQRRLAIRGYYNGPIDGRVRPELEAALRTFTTAAGIETTSETGSVMASAIDALGAGSDVARRWGDALQPRTDMTAAECRRVNDALARRGYRDDGRIPDVVDARTIEALRRFQADTGAAVQRGHFVARRWLFVLGVATPESCPDLVATTTTTTTATVPAGLTREAMDVPDRSTPAMPEKKLLPPPPPCDPRLFEGAPRLDGSGPDQSSGTAPVSSPSTANAQSSGTAPASSPSTANAQSSSTMPVSSSSTANDQSSSTAPVPSSSTAADQSSSTLALPSFHRVGDTAAVPSTARAYQMTGVAMKDVDLGSQVRANAQATDQPRMSNTREDVPHSDKLPGNGPVPNSDRVVTPGTPR